jgi:acid stress-induced BolA-like protein IbaG/YrbA
MQIEPLKHFIAEHLPCDWLHVEGDGRHFDAIIVSDQFEGLSTLKRQQRVYGFLNELITQGQLHAFSMKTYTPKEWDQKKDQQHG